MSRVLGTGRGQRVIALMASFSAFAVVLTIGVPGAVASESTCDAGPLNAVRASLVPTHAIARDVAFMDDDPDAERAPLESITYPSELSLWASVSGATDGAVAYAVDRSWQPETTLASRFAERSDRDVSDSVVRLYCALLDREPDPFELQYWAGRYWSGLPLVSIAEAFTLSPEFIVRFGMPTDLGLVAVLSDQILGRPAGTGASSFASALAAGEMTRGELIVSFTESAEYIAMTGTSRPVKPQLPYPAVGSGERVIYDNTNNRVYLIESSGELAKSHLVTGRRGIPSAGRYNVYSKSRYAWAPYDGITMEYMVRFARGEWPYGFHSIPIWPDDSPLQSPEQLGTHRSGGCVRQEFDDAEFMFGWADLGTRVIVIRP